MICAETRTHVQMKVAVTGTPGVGKTSATALIRSIRVIRVNDLVDEYDAITGIDEERGSKEVDVDKLKAALSKMDGDMLLEGHLSHLLGVDIAIVLRCSPAVLRERLELRGWSAAKVMENMEAEAVDVILVEALGCVPKTCEIDATGMSSEAVAKAIEEIIAGESEKYPVGNVDWSQEVMSWF